MGRIGKLSIYILAAGIFAFGAFTLNRNIKPSDQNISKSVITKKIVDIRNGPIQENLERAKRYLDERNYLSAEISLDIVENYAKEAGVEVPAEVPDLRKKTYTIGIKENLENVKKYLEEGDYLSAYNSLNLVEIYANKAGMEVLAEVQSLREKIEEKLFIEKPGEKEFREKGFEMNSDEWQYNKLHC